MNIEMWFTNNSDNALLQEDKAVEIGFIGRSPNYIKDKLRSSRAYVGTI